MPQKPLSLEQVVERLVETSKVIQRRMGLKPGEEARVKDAFSLLASGHCEGKKKPYVEFLQRVHKKIGGYGVVLCAAVGPTLVLSLKDRDRVDLVVRLEEKKDAIMKGELQALANKYTGKHLRRNGMTSILYTVDLCSFLTKYNGIYRTLTVNMGFGEKDLPSIELSNELLQDLLIHTMETNQQRISSGDIGAGQNEPHGGTTV